MELKQIITEEMKIQDEWYKESNSEMTPEKFKEFFRHLSEDYVHDYGTVCHAMAAVGLAAMWAFNNSEGAMGGITGFQAGCVMWQIIEKWNYRDNKCGLRIQNMDDLLYPQYDHKFISISKDSWKAVQEEAKRRINENEENYKTYLLEIEQYEKDMDKFREDVKEFEKTHPEYPKYEDNPRFYEHIGGGTIKEWEEERRKENSGFLFSPRKPYCNTAHPEVLKHWQSIVSGKIPFGLKIEEE